MHRPSSVALISSFLISCLCLACLSLFGQESRVVRVGVATIQAGRGSPPGAEVRDRLVKFLNQRKPDKNSGFSLQAVPLEALSQSKAVAEAREKNCDFLLYAHLTDLTTTYNLSNDMYLPVFHATAEYQLNRVADASGFAMQSVDVEDSGSSQTAIWRVFSKVASSAWSEIEVGKGTTNVPAIEMPVALTNPSLMQFVDARVYCSWLPADMAHAEKLRGGCEYAISLPEKMPNFVCGQQTARYQGASRAPLDLISASVRYEDGHESYSDVKINDRPVPGGEAGAGLRSTGEFGGNLRAIFNRRNHALFSYSGEANLGDHRAWIFTYEIAEQKDPLWLLHAPGQIISPPYSGELWIDQSDGSVLRFRSVAKDIPLTFPMRSVEQQIDYDKVVFGDGTRFVLPAESTLTNVYTGQEASRNVEQFRDCHKFSARGRLVLKADSASESAPSAQVPASLASLQKDLDESEAMFAAIGERALQEDQARREAEQRQMLEEADAPNLEKMAALRREQEQIEAQRQAIAKSEAAVADTTPHTTLRVDVRLVLVSAVPRDPKGNAVGNLVQQNFRLFDEGQPQVIKHFSVEAPGTGVPPESEAEAPAGIRARDQLRANQSSANHGFSNESSPDQSSGSEVGRANAYLFDDVHLDSADLASARAAAERHLGKLLAGEVAAVFTTSGSVVVDFTADREKLLAALRDLKPHAIIPESDCPPISHYVADLMLNQGDTEARGVALAEAEECAARGSFPGPHAQHVAAAKAAEVLNIGNVESKSALVSLASVVRRLESMPGERSIVLVSAGFLALTQDAQRNMMEIVDHAAGAGIVINTLDAGGLLAGGPAASIGDPQFDFAEAQARSEVMAEFASGTGGIYFHNNNNLDEGFRRTASAPGFVYLLGFSPQRLDGKFHRLKVTLNNAGNLEVQARRGYYALKPTSAKQN